MSWIFVSAATVPALYEWIPLFSDPMVVMVSKDHPLAKEIHYPIKHFETDPFIDFRPDADTDAKGCCKNIGSNPTIVLQQPLIILPI